MRRTFGTGLAIAVLALVIGCGKKGGPTPDSAPPLGGGSGSIEGTWLLVGMETSGKPTPKIDARPEAERTIKITADQMIATRNGQEDPANYKLDHSKNPNEIDMTPTKGSDKSQTMYGIYKFEGDKLTICAALSDTPADRPKEFKTTEATKTVLMTLKKK